jgi:hypothetical protein
MEAAQRRPPHRPSLKLPTAVHPTHRPGKKFAEIAGQILGKAVRLWVLAAFTNNSTVGR